MKRLSWFYYFSYRCMAPSPLHLLLPIYANCDPPTPPLQDRVFDEREIPQKYKMVFHNL